MALFALEMAKKFESAKDCGNDHYFYTAYQH